jgi:tRNA (pseudouridine54-N1)-methyltransferase
MRSFVVRARAAPVDSQKFLAAVGGDAHTEILAHALINAFFVAQSHRDDVIVHLVLESTSDYSRTITFNAGELGSLGGFHEAALLWQVATALKVSAGMNKSDQRQVAPGIAVRTISFEKLVQELAISCQLFVMDKKGTPIEQQPFQGHPCFILTDHIPMPRKISNSLQRLGASKISLGPKMLFASQCVVLIHNRLDLAAY